MSGMEIVLTAVCGLLGGCNVLQLLFLRQTRRKYAAEADKAGISAKTDDFAVLRDTTVFHQEQLRQKEERFAEQTELVRNLNRERIEDSGRMLELTKKYGELELREQKFHCEVRGCANRKPPNGY